jgi:hypothetical protein
MANPSKQKGTAAETALVRYLRLHGFGGADRQPLRGNRDAGDILLCPGIVIEVKAHKSAGTGQPAPAQLTDWMGQAEAERLNAGAAHAPLVVKRSGTTDPGHWFAWLPAWSVAALMEGVAGLPNPTAPVGMTVAVLIGLLRRAGYGTALEAAS